MPKTFAVHIFIVRVVCSISSLFQFFFCIHRTLISLLNPKDQKLNMLNILRLSNKLARIAGWLNEIIVCVYVSGSHFPSQVHSVCLFAAKIKSNLENLFEFVLNSISHFLTKNHRVLFSQFIYACMDVCAWWCMCRQPRNYGAQMRSK